MEDYLKYQKWNISATTGQNFKFKLLRANQTLQMFQTKTTSSGWQLQISKVKYLSNTRSDLPQIGNISLVDQIVDLE